MQRSPLSIAPVLSARAARDARAAREVPDGRPARDGRLAPAAREFVYELKFFVGLEQSAALKHWIRTHLQPDPYGGGPHGDTYQVSSLYFDTSALHVLGRQGSYARSKYRVRRYNQSDTVFLERKIRGQCRVFKRRSATGIDSLLRLQTSQSAADWDGHWFHRRLLARALRAVSGVDYQRMARITHGDYGPARLTLDQGLQAWQARGLSFEAHGRGSALSGEQLILELKFGIAMPMLFKQLIREFAPRLAGISKYRLACLHLGLATPLPTSAAVDALPLRRRAL